MVAFERAAELDRVPHAASSHAPVAAPGVASGRASHRLVALAAVTAVVAVELTWLGLLLFLLVHLVRA